MTDRPTRIIELRLDLTDDELAELERALIKARATELGEVRRRNVRYVAGYGDETTREVLDDEGRRAQIRYEVLSKLLEALRTSGGGGGELR
jgi:peptidoglycan/xylan/chitin deacetylase (PgdA/CDA1 family)